MISDRVQAVKNLAPGIPGCCLLYGTSMGLIFPKLTEQNRNWTLFTVNLCKSVQFFGRIVKTIRTPKTILYNLQKQSQPISKSRREVISTINENTKHSFRHDCLYRYSAYAKSLTDSTVEVMREQERPARGEAEQPQKIRNIMNTTPTRVHGATVCTVYTPNRVYCVHVNTTPHSVHGETTPAPVQRKRPMRPHDLTPLSPLLVQGEGRVRQSGPKKIINLVNTTPNNAHGDTVYTPNCVYSVHVNTTPARVHGDDGYCDSTAQKQRHGLVEMMREQERPASDEAKQPQKIGIRVYTIYTPNSVYSVHVNTTPYSVHGDDGYCDSTAQKQRHGLVEMMREQERPARGEAEQPQRIINIVNTTPYSVHGDTTPARVQRKRPMRPHPLIPSPCARRGVGAAEQSQKIINIVNTTRTRVHGDTVYTSNRVYSVHVNTTPYSVHGDTVYTPNRVYFVHVNTTHTRVHGDHEKSRCFSLGINQDPCTVHSYFNHQIPFN